MYKLKREYGQYWVQWDAEGLGGQKMQWEHFDTLEEAFDYIRKSIEK